MKKKDIEKEAKEVLDFTVNVLEDLENIIEQNYCSVCAHNDKKTLKILKKNSKMIFKIYSEINKRKELDIK